MYVQQILFQILSKWSELTNLFPPEIIKKPTILMILGGTEID